MPPQNPVDRTIVDVPTLGVKPSCPVALDDVVRPSGPVDVIDGHGSDPAAYELDFAIALDAKSGLIRHHHRAFPSSECTGTMRSLASPLFAVLRGRSWYWTWTCKRLTEADISKPDQCSNIFRAFS